MAAWLKCCCKGDFLPLVLMPLLLLQRPIGRGCSGASPLRESYAVDGARTQSGGGAHCSNVSVRSKKRLERVFLESMKKVKRAERKKRRRRRRQGKKRKNHKSTKTKKEKGRKKEREKRACCSFSSLRVQLHPAMLSHVLRSAGRRVRKEKKLSRRAQTELPFLFDSHRRRSCLPSRCFFLLRRRDCFGETPSLRVLMRKHALCRLERVAASPFDAVAGRKKQGRVFETTFGRSFTSSRWGTDRRN